METEQNTDTTTSSGQQTLNTLGRGLLKSLRFVNEAEATGQKNNNIVISQYKDDIIVHHTSSRLS